MAFRKTFYIIVFTFQLMSIPYAFTDEIVLHNGSRLIGNVVKKEDRLLKLKTDFAGTLDIQWAKVKSLKTDRSMTVMLKNKEIITDIIDGEYRYQWIGHH